MLPWMKYNRSCLLLLNLRCFFTLLVLVQQWKNLSTKILMLELLIF